MITLLQIFFTITCLTLSAWVSFTNAATDNLTQFIAMGDMPYTDSEYTLLEPDGTIATAIRAIGPQVLIHLGDFKKARLSCSNELFKDHYRQIAYLHPHKTVYTPGDNDWTDCDRFNTSVRYDELERLNYLRHLFFYQDEHQLSRDIVGLVRQKELVENSRWKIDHIVFVTLHIPGTNNGRKEILRSHIQHALDMADNRDQLNGRWLHELFKMTESVEAVVIAFHADIFNFDHRKPACSIDNRTNCDGYRIMRNLIKDNAAQFRKPVLLIHGDSPAYCLHQPYPFIIPNLWRLNVPGDYKHIGVSHISFDPRNKNMPFKVTNVLDQKPAPEVCDYSLFGFSGYSPF